MGQVLAREGFGGIGVNAIAKQAGVDKVLIYRYFGGLPELLAFYGGSGQFWPGVDELLDPETAAPPPPLVQRLDVLLERFIAALQRRPLTIEILAWETVERNELTAVLESVREDWGRELETRLRARHPDISGDIPALMIVFTAAIQYLLVRARTIRVYGGIDLHTQAGWTRLRAAMGEALRALLDPAHAAEDGKVERAGRAPVQAAGSRSGRPRPGRK